MSSTISTSAPSSEMSRSLVTLTSPELEVPFPYVEIPMKSTKTSRCMARARSVRKKQAPLRMQMSCNWPVGYSREICAPSSRIRAWIFSAEIRTRSLGSTMELLLSAGNQFRAHRSDMNVRARGFSRHCLPKRKKRNVVLSQVLAQPGAFRLVRIQGHVDAPVMVEAHGPMHRGFTYRADRKLLPEMF